MDVIGCIIVNADANITGVRSSSAGEQQRDASYHPGKTARPVTMTHDAHLPSETGSLAPLWLLIALSSIVFIEPAPYDVLGIGLFLFLVARGLRFPAGANKATLLLGIYLLGNVVSSFLAPDPVATLRSLSIRIYLVLSWLMFVGLIYRNAEPVLNTIWSGYLVAGAIAVIAGIVGYFGLLPTGDLLLENDRVRAFFKDPNVFGPYLVPLVFYALARAEAAGPAGMLRWVGCFGFFAFGVLLSYSRGSWLNVGFSLLFYLGLRLWMEDSVARRARLLGVALVTAIIGGLIIGIASGTGKIGEMLQRRAQAQNYDLRATNGRFSNQFDVLQHVLTHPLGAYGPGGADAPMAPHNLYLHVIAEAGWIGGLAFWGFILLTIAIGWGYLRRAPPPQHAYTACFACVLGTLVQSAFIDSTHWRHLFLLFAIVWGTALAYRPFIAHNPRSSS